MEIAFTLPLPAAFGMMFIPDNVLITIMNIVRVVHFAVTSKAYAITRKTIVESCFKPKLQVHS
jgi:hypothetical protein